MRSLSSNKTNILFSVSMFFVKLINKSYSIKPKFMQWGYVVIF